MYNISTKHIAIGTEKKTYHFTQQKDILASHQEDPARDIGVQVSSIDSFNGILENEVRCNIARTEVRRRGFSEWQCNSYRIDPSFARLQSVSSHHAEQVQVFLYSRSGVCISN